MKKVLEAIVLCAMVMMGTGCVTHEAARTTLFGKSRDALQQVLDDARQQLYGDWPEDAPVGLALLVSDGEHELFLKSHLPQDVTADSHYRIASMSKTFTAAAVLLLVQEGKINLDDRIVAHMPGRVEPYVPASKEFDFPYKDQITVRQLLQHTSGIYDLTNEDIKTKDKVPYAGRDYTVWKEEQDSLHSFTVEELVGVQSRHRQVYGKPLSDEYYSNVGFSLLTLIVERVTGMEFAEFMRIRLLQPNGLADTSLVVSGADWKLPKPFLHGYRWEDKVLEDVTERNASAFIGSGNIVSTQHDIVRWLRRLNEYKSGLSKETVAVMQTCNEHDYGLGTRLLQKRAYGHTGLLRGYFGSSFYDRKTGLSWVLLCNAVSDLESGHGNMLREIQRKMLELYEGTSK